MITAEELRSREKVRLVKEQILDIKGNPVGGKGVITCPYCGENNFEGSELCCKLLRDCVITILMGLRQGRIEEKASQYVN